MISPAPSSTRPARNPDRNIADLKAQVAACARGAAELRRVAAEQGRAVVDAYMGHVMAYAEEAVRRLIGRLSDGQFRYELDNGAFVQVAIRVDRETRTAEVDFTGTSPQQTNNFNAPYSICRAATNQAGAASPASAKTGMMTVMSGKCVPPR